MKQITKSEFNEATASGISVIDFFATRCWPCKMSTPYIEDMSKKLEGKANFYKVDVDKEQELAWEQGVTGMPTFMIFQDGELVEKIVWADLKRLRTKLQELTGA